MFGGLAHFLDTKEKAYIYIDAARETCTSGRERDSWSFCRTTPDVFTKGLSHFATGQTIQLFEIAVTGFTPAKIEGRCRLLCRAINHEEFDERKMD
jgi:hypothetical protein